MWWDLPELIEINRCLSRPFTLWWEISWFFLLWKAFADCRCYHAISCSITFNIVTMWCPHWIRLNVGPLYLYQMVNDDSFCFLLKKNLEPKKSSKQFINRTRHQQLCIMRERFWLLPPLQCCSLIFSFYAVITESGKPIFEAKCRICIMYMKHFNHNNVCLACSNTSENAKFQSVATLMRKHYKNSLRAEIPVFVTLEFWQEVQLRANGSRQKDCLKRTFDLFHNVVWCVSPELRVSFSYRDIISE